MTVDQMERAALPLRRVSLFGQFMQPPEDPSIKRCM